MASLYAQEKNSLSPYRKLLVDLSFDLSKKEVETLKLAGVDFIPRRITENIATGLQFFDVLEQDGRIGPRNLDLLQDMLKTLGRVDLARKIQAFLSTSVKGQTDEDTFSDGSFRNTENGNLANHPENEGTLSFNDTEGALTCDLMAWQNDSVPDGIGDDPRNDVARSRQVGTHHTSNFREMAAGQVKASQLARQLPLYSADHAGGPTVVRSGSQGAVAPQISYCFAGCTSSDGNKGSSSSFKGPSAPVTSGTQTVHQHAGTQDSSSGRIKHVGPEPARYVDFLACQGYVVEILGGKHFKTPEGEFVEMKSGTQYKIHVKNTRAYGCNLDISIDGYDVGGWVVDGGQEFTIERPAYEAKKFTFYRVKTAPEEAGIEPGRAENGVVKCVFTPEAFQNIPVIISGSPLPLDIIMPPSATVGDLKREIQHQLNVSDDPDQVLCSDEKVLLNSDSVRGLPTGNLRFIDTELEITIKTSTKTNFSVKVHPGGAKVRDVMEQIERKLNVPIRDQTLYHGTAYLSHAPRRGLPYGLICGPQPTLFVIVPEYIHITVEDQNGDLHTIKIDKENNLTALMEEIPSCSSLENNVAPMFYFNGKPLRPFKDKGTLTSLGLCSGSKLELKVNIIFIDVLVFFPNGDVDLVRCYPQETFRDLVKKLEMEGKKRELEKVIFAWFERVYDPEQDKAPLLEYGITHGSVLQIRKVRAQSNAASGESGNADVSMCEEGSASEMPEFRALANRKKVFQPQSRSFKGNASARVVEPDPTWRSGGTTLQGYSTQQFMTADPIKVDPSRKVELVLRLVAREDEEDLVFPKDECKPLSTLCPPPVPD